MNKEMNLGTQAHYQLRSIIVDEIKKTDLKEIAESLILEIVGAEKSGAENKLTEAKTYLDRLLSIKYPGLILELGFEHDVRITGAINRAYRDIPTVEKTLKEDYAEFNKLYLLSRKHGSYAEFEQFLEDRLKEIRKYEEERKIDPLAQQFLSELKKSDENPDYETAKLLMAHNEKMKPYYTLFSIINSKCIGERIKNTAVEGIINSSFFGPRLENFVIGESIARYECSLNFTVFRDALLYGKEKIIGAIREGPIVDCINAYRDKK